MASNLFVPDRRHFLKHVAGASLLAVPGMRFVQGLAQAAPDLKKRHKSVIILWMGGGPATIDLWDLKPDSQNGGEFKPINTTASGVQICEHLPTIAKQMKHLSVVRSLETTEGDHNRGTVLMNTGRPPSPLVQYPALGAIAAQQLTPKDLDLPSFISIGGTAQRIGPGFLGMTYAPFTVQNAGQPPENIKKPDGVTDLNMARRKLLFEELEKNFEVKDASGVALRGEAAKAHQDVYDKAFKLVMPDMKVTAAGKGGDRSKLFDLGDAKNKAAVEKYGNNGFGKGCLLARNLVEAGAVCVEVDFGGWDNHQNVFPTLKTKLPILDKAMAALVEDLVQSGMWQDTVVVWMGEFGRTPRINQNAGRDHWARCWSVVVGGGAIKGGQVIGATDKDGSAVKENPVKVGDLFATIYKGMGLDPNTQVRDNLGRPTAIAGDNVKPIAGLV